MTLVFLNFPLVIFKIYDTDRDGKISKDDLGHVSYLYCLVAFK